MKHESTGTYAGERCRVSYRSGHVCGEPATHKLGEEDPSHGQRSPGDIGLRLPFLHNLTAYVCCYHFTMVVGSASGCFP